MGRIANPNRTRVYTLYKEGRVYYEGTKVVTIGMKTAECQLSKKLVVIRPPNPNSEASTLIYDINNPLTENEHITGYLCNTIETQLKSRAVAGSNVELSVVDAHGFAAGDSLTIVASDGTYSEDFVASNVVIGEPNGTHTITAPTLSKNYSSGTKIVKDIDTVNVIVTGFASGTPDTVYVGSTKGLSNGDTITIYKADGSTSESATISNLTTTSFKANLSGTYASGDIVYMLGDYYKDDSSSDEADSSPMNDLKLISRDRGVAYLVDGFRVHSVGIEKVAIKRKGESGGAGGGGAPAIEVALNIFYGEEMGAEE
jgi:hypothetical protein